MKTKSWFRVVVDAQGAVKDCKPVSSSGTDDAGVFFVLADSAKAASKSAVKSHEARLLAARRARYATEGRCQCGGERDRPGFITCQRCADRQRLHYDRKNARARGEEVPPLDRRTVLQERKAQEAAGIRLEVLIEVQRAYHKMRGQGATFERWLGKQVEAIAGKKVA